MRILILFVVLSTTWRAYAQNLQVKYRPCNPCGTNLNDDFEYGEAVVFPTESVISDYGIRHVNSGSTFHQAIDYTVRGEEDAKYALQAVNGGTITSISQGNNEGYKIIKVGGYGYGHIFTTKEKTNPQRYGKFVLAKLDNYNEWAIIDLEFCRCFAASNGEQVTVNDLDLKFCNKKVFTTTNEVETGWDIAPLGISGTPYSHLHLERYVGGTGRRADPNQYVAHAETDFEVILKSETSDDNEVKLTYPGTKPSPLRVRAKMIGATKIHSDGYTNVTMSVDNVGILIERNGQSGYEEIIGPKYNSRIGIGARDDSPLTPWNESGFNAQHNNKKFGSWDRMGIRPFAHNDVVTPTNLRNEPYDDYFFADFYTRIHKDKHDAFTDIPSNARYNDGKYNLKPTVTNVRDELFTIPGIDVTLDNYLPYLTEVNIKYNGEVLYQAERVGNEGTKSPDDGFVMNHIHEYPISPGQLLPNTLTVEVLTSEPMQNVRMSYKKAGQITVFPNPVAMTKDITDNLRWTGSIATFNPGDCYDVQFKGQDLSGNEVINVSLLLIQHPRQLF